MNIPQTAPSQQFFQLFRAIQRKNNKRKVHYKSLFGKYTIIMTNHYFTKNNNDSLKKGTMLMNNIVADKTLVVISK